MMRTISILAVLSFLTMESGHAQTGACCVNFECVGTMLQEDCFTSYGYWFPGEDCEAGFECPTEYPCGDYVIGDYNRSGAANIVDIVEAFASLKRGSPAYPIVDCECPPGSGNLWPAGGDVNSSCAMNMADVVHLYSKLKTGSPELTPCMDCPPDSWNQAPVKQEAIE